MPCFESLWTENLAKRREASTGGTRGNYFARGDVMWYSLSGAHYYIMRQASRRRRRRLRKGDKRAAIGNWQTDADRGARGRMLKNRSFDRAQRQEKRGYETRDPADGKMGGETRTGQRCNEKKHTA